MTGSNRLRLGLIVCSTAYAQRSARTQLDVALLAASLDWDLRLYFTGSGVLQLVPRGDTGAALLPVAYRAWASLPELIDTAELLAYAEPAWLDRLKAAGLATCLPLVALSAGDMRRDWAACDRVLVL